MNNNNAKQQYLSSDCDANFLVFLYADEELDFYSKSAFRPPVSSHISYPLPNTHSHFGVGKVTFKLGCQKWHKIGFALLKKLSCSF